MTGYPTVRITGFSIVAERTHPKYLPRPCGDSCDGLNHWRFEGPAGEFAGKAEFYNIPQKALDVAHAAGLAR